MPPGFAPIATKVKAEQLIRETDSGPPDDD
jgi:hypothetical protein